MTIKGRLAKLESAVSGDSWLYIVKADRQDNGPDLYQRLGIAPPELLNRLPRG